MSHTWTIDEGRGLELQLQELLQALGLEIQIVGSVSRQGFSDNDLDFSIRPAKNGAPTPIIDLEGVLAVIYDVLVPALGLRPNMTPLESASRSGDWFVGCELPDGRAVEFYVSEHDFPLDPVTPAPEKPCVPLAAYR